MAIGGLIRPSKSRLSSDGCRQFFSNFTDPMATDWSILRCSRWSPLLEQFRVASGG
jgi:hypothetical protein